MFSDFLCSIVLAGIFSAVSELLLPSRLSSLGRLLRAVIAVWIVFLMASPILSFVFGRTPEDLLPTFSGIEAEKNEEKSLSPEEAITTLAERRIAETVETELIALWSVDCRVETGFELDINRLSARIYCDSPPQDFEETLQTLGERYGMEISLIDEGGKALG